MKIKNLITAALVALAASTAPALHAAFTYTSGDIFLGVRQVGNTTSDFVVDIGSGPTFRDALAPITLTLTNLSTTLAGLFGTNYATDSTLRYAFFGTTHTDGAPGDPVRVIYVSEPIGNNAPTQATNQSTIATNIIGLKNYYSPLADTAVPNSGVGSPGNANSFTTRVTSVFGSSNITPIESSIANLSFYRVPQTANGPVTNEGTFSLTGDSLTFTPTAVVPEPSTYALLAVSGVAFYIIRRRSVKS